MPDQPRDVATSHCTVCGSERLEPLLEIPSVPVHCNLLWESREAARSAPRGDIDLAVCRDCAHVQNRAFDPARMAYSEAYENSLHFSPRFQEYAEALARRLVERYGLYGKTILEIGSGKGEFIRRLAELGGNHGIGFDPAYVPGQEGEPASGRLTFITDFYSEKYAHYGGDLICCRQVLEHLPEPTGFLRALRASIGERGGTGVFFEVPNALFMLRDLSIWDIIYEHPSYFSRASLAQAFTLAGYGVDEVSEAFEGQFLWLDAHPNRAPAEGDGDDWGREEVLAFARAFAQRYRQRVASWRGRLADLAATGRRVAVWGAGSKGVTFLNALEAGEAVSGVVDINPRKQGRYVAGTGQQIVAPAELAVLRPDVVVVMNAAYVGEIGRELRRMGLDADLVAA